MMNMKKWFSVIMCCALILPLMSVSAGQAQAQEEGAIPSITLPDGSKLQVDAVNAVRKDNGITVYTGDYSEPFTASFENSKVMEFIVSGEIVLEKNTDGTKGTYIPLNNVVISASGSAKDKMKAITTGDTLTLNGVTVPQQMNRYAVVKGIEIPINKVNAFRDENDVVLYDAGYGTSTNTNQWGLELMIENGRITGMAKPDGKTYNNSRIPSQGYVLSVQAGSPHYSDLNAKITSGELVTGDPAEIMIREETHLASRIAYDAMDPKVREDNPGGWDSANNKPFDGFRGGDQLIVYSPDYGKDTTGTNAWGFEVIVDENDRIISVGGNNSPIPDKGYVLSGHGVKADWLKNYAKLSATVSMNRPDKEIVVMLTPQSSLDRADYRIETSTALLQKSKEMYMDVPYAQIEQKIAEAKNVRGEIAKLIEQQAYDQMTLKSAALDSLMDEVINLNMESRKVEHRAIWIRPLETNIDEVRQHLKLIADANLNQVYVETWWSGYTIYPSSNPLAPQNPMYKGFDVLQAYLDVADELGLEIHVWVENAFLEGNKMEEKPEWSMIRRDGADYWEVDGHTFYWLNPALPEVRKFIAALYSDLVTRYPVAGLHLDYIRYPDNYGTDIDYGYDTYTRNEFMKKYKTDVDPVNLYPGDKLWPEWQQFRMDIITGFVIELVSQLKETSPKLAISAAVYSDFYSNPYYKLQEAGLWLQQGYLDNIFPMSYKLDAQAVVHDAEETMKLAGDLSYVTMGLGPQAKVSRPVLVEQANETQKNGTSGSAYFEFLSYFGDQYNMPLKQGVYRNKAIVPFSHPGLSVKTILMEMDRKIDEIYVPNQGMTNVKDYKKDLKVLINRLNENKTIDKRAAKLDGDLQQLMKKLSQDSSVNEQVKNRMMYDLKYAEHIIKIYKNKNQGEL